MQPRRHLTYWFRKWCVGPGRRSSELRSPGTMPAAAQPFVGQCEQSCSEQPTAGVSSLAWRKCGEEDRPQERFCPLPHDGTIRDERKNEGGYLMEPVLRQFRDDFRRRLARITGSVSRMFASLTPPVRGFPSARMCPFCGLITPRSKTSCLECGKSLAPVGTR